MSFSEYGYFVRGDYSALAAQDRPVDAGVARAMANNAQHLHDQHSQVLVNLVSATDIPPTSGNIGVTLTSTSWQRVLHLGPFPVHMRPTSGAYRFRVRAAVAHEAGSAANFRVGIGPGDSLLSVVDWATPPSNMFTSTTTINYGTWRTPTDSILTMPPEVEPFLYESVPTVDASGDPTTTNAAMVYVDLFIKAASNPQTFYIDGLYVAEYVGTP